MKPGYSSNLFDAAIRPLLAAPLQDEVEALLQNELKQVDDLLDTIHQFQVESVGEPALVFQAAFKKCGNEE